MSLHRFFTPASVGLVCVFAALIAASTLAPEITLAVGVPISLQTFAVVLSALVLGPWRGVAAVSLYLLVGLAGAPIFANGVGGTAIFARPSWGFLLGMALAAIVVGELARRLRRAGRASVTMLVVAGLASIPVVYAVGVPVLAHMVGLPVVGVAEGCSAISLDAASGCANALTLGAIPFLPGDVVKVVLAALIAAAVHRAYPMILPRAAATQASDVPRTSDSHVPSDA